MRGVDEAHAAADDGWDRAARHETPTQRLDRNWASLLQELRVTETGVQLLTGFLLILPFQPKFGTLSGLERGVYLVAMLSAVAATVLIVAPVGMHRVLFRQHRLATLVATAHGCALAGGALLGLAMSCVVVLTVSVVVGTGFGILAGAVAAGMCTFFWVVWPLLLRRRPGDR